MKLLLDSHTLIRHSDSSPWMSAAATALVNDQSNDLYLSMASAWEIAIKAGLKKLTHSVPYIPFMGKAAMTYRVTLMPITIDDCIAYEQLPFPDPKHRDPFDRMIVVHANRNGLPLVSADAAFDAYGVTRLW